MSTSEQLVQAALAEVITRSVEQASALLGRADTLFVDVREAVELQREGSVPGAFHAPRGVLEFWADPQSAWCRPELVQPGVHLLLYCAVGWRSALAAQSLQQMGRTGVSHLGGGFAAWKAAGGAVSQLHQAGSKVLTL